MTIGSVRGQGQIDCINRLDAFDFPRDRPAISQIKARIHQHFSTKLPEYRFGRERWLTQAASVRDFDIH
ncbi:hypothetical protein A8H29_31670 [Burkholderia cenocepacia]|nr:hypothetical protein WQ49_01210 [Burkholderia cenocepacia]PNE61840.1 hypothetical protein A8H29_31670 [Burkholderia cenocepacia]